MYSKALKKLREQFLALPIFPRNAPAGWLLTAIAAESEGFRKKLPPLVERLLSDLSSDLVCRHSVADFARRTTTSLRFRDMLCSIAGAG